MQPPSHFVSSERSPQPASVPTWFIATLAGCALVITAYVLGTKWIAETSLGLPLGVWAVMTIAGVSGYLEHRRKSLTSEVWSGEESDSPAAESEVREERRPARFDGFVRGGGDREDTKRTLVAGQVHALSLVRDLPENDAGSSSAPTKAETAAEPAAAPAERAAPIARPARTKLNINWPDDLLGLARVHAVRYAALIANSLRLLPQQRTLNWLDSSPGATRKLRIGLAGTDRSSAFGDARSPDTEVVSVPLGDASELLESNDLDAVVLAGGDSLTISTRENEGREAAWFDWGATRPVSYFSLFPLRLDPGQVSFGAGQGSVGNPAMTFWLARAAAANARHRDRLTLRDRLTGRTTTTADRVRGLDDLSSVMLDLARDLGECREGSPQSRVTARAATAFLATAGTGILAAERIALMERAASFAPGEPEVLLRLAAVRFAVLDDKRGMEALLQAERILRVSPTLQPTGVIPLIEAELEHGAFGEMTVGRVAAGICLAAATTSPDRLSYLREDLFEDMRLSSWLIGRDPEHALLMNAFMQLERQRRADLMGLPEARHEAKAQDSTEAVAPKARKPRKKKAA